MSSPSHRNPYCSVCMDPSGTIPLIPTECHMLRNEMMYVYIDVVFKRLTVKEFTVRIELSTYVQSNLHLSVCRALIGQKVT